MISREELDKIPLFQGISPEAAANIADHFLLSWPAGLTFSKTATKSIFSRVDIVIFSDVFRNVRVYQRPY